ncbi:zinc-binding alcohol dehydrogenase family protein [Alicyclobacillus herbarius]|uniref:zinc-binding alcohol dehydrogenase family protein n=1 Tax=Alicyclobacillus herbarius TaxID=122960 RepID=UPI0003F50474|nr:zinc-binding alcohol dehydrogenase family protein [Alicyclobacillus herbarius]
MKRVVCREPGVLQIEAAAVPEPNPGEALVRIRRVGVCGTDIHAYRGRQPFVSYPRVFGHELAGEVVSVHGDGEWRPGEAVTILPYLSCGKCVACRTGKPNCCTELQTFGVHVDGGMQEYITMPVQYLVKGGSLSLDELAVVECLAIGAHAVWRAKVRPGEHVLVVGAGPIGLGVMRFAKLAGATVIGMDTNEARLAFSQRWAGVDQIVQPGRAARTQLLEWTGGDNPAVVFDATGNVQSMASALSYLAHGGRLVYVGLVQDNVPLPDPEFHKREAMLLASRNSTREDFRRVMEAIAGGQVEVSTFITHRAGLNEVVDRFDAWTRPETGVIKAMVEV